SGASGTTSSVNVGNTTEESSADYNADGAQAYKVTASVTGTVTSVSVYVDSTDGSNVQMGVYNDDGSGTSPDTLLTNSSIQTVSTGWNTLSVPGVPIQSGTVYWIAFTGNGATTYRTDTSGGTTAYQLSTGYPLPSTFVS